MQNLNKVAFVDLEQVFMNISERTYVLNQIFGFEQQAIKNFEQLLHNQMVEETEKKIKIKRRQEINLAYFLQCCLFHFENKVSDPQEQQQEIKKIKTRMTILQNDVPQRDTGLLQRMTLIMNKGLLNDIPDHDLDFTKEEIKNIRNELKESLRLKYLYKNSSIN